MWPWRQQLRPRCTPASATLPWCNFTSCWIAIGLLALRARPPALRPAAVSLTGGLPLVVPYTWCKAAETVRCVLQSLHRPCHLSTLKQVLDTGPAMTQDQELQDPLAEVLGGLRDADKRLGVAFGRPGMLAELAARDQFATPVLCALALANRNGRGLPTRQRHDAWCCVPLPLLPATVECLRCAMIAGVRPPGCTSSGTQVHLQSSGMTRPVRPSAAGVIKRCLCIASCCCAGREGVLRKPGHEQSVPNAGLQRLAVGSRCCWQRRRHTVQRSWHTLPAGRRA